MPAARARASTSCGPLALDHVVGGADHLEAVAVGVAAEQAGGGVDEEVAALAGRDHGDGADHERPRRVADRGRLGRHRARLVDDPRPVAAPREPRGARLRDGDELVEALPGGAAQQPAAQVEREHLVDVEQRRHAVAPGDERLGEGEDRVRVHERRRPGAQEGAVAAQVPGAAASRRRGPGRQPPGADAVLERPRGAVDVPAARGQLVEELARARDPEAELPAALAEQRHDPLHGPRRPAEMGLVEADDDPGPAHGRPG